MLQFDEMMSVLDKHVVLAHRNIDPQVDMLYHFDKLSWFHINQFLLFLLNAVFIVEKYQIPILHLIGPDRSSNSHSNLHFEYDLST
jgi:hypothetical protein